METERELPLPGEIWRHFKRKHYKIICLARHSEDGTWFVIYEGGRNIYARPLDMFMSRVDREKYPKAEQEWRFEKV